MATSTADLIHLGFGSLTLTLAPACGSVARFRYDDGRRALDLFRTAPEGETRDPLAMGCFPLVPFSNRIGHGRFPFLGREIELPRNMVFEPHTIHGHGWIEPWHVEAVSPSEALLAYRHSADAWPWAYRATQRFTLGHDRLDVRLEVENLSDEPMPLGMGLHPYFPRPAGTRLKASVEAVWYNDAAMLPSLQGPPPPEWDLTQGPQLDAMRVDNCFSGWDGTAEIAWPDGTRLTMTADPRFGHLVVYVPDGETFFCAEPATNANDGFNLAARGIADAGVIVVPPGGSAGGTVSFAVTLPR